MKLSDELLQDLRTTLSVAEVATTELWLTTVADSLESLSGKIRKEAKLASEPDSLPVIEVRARLMGGPGDGLWVLARVGATYYEYFREDVRYLYLPAKEAVTEHTRALNFSRPIAREEVEA